MGLYQYISVVFIIYFIFLFRLVSNSCFSRLIIIAFFYSFNNNICRRIRNLKIFNFVNKVILFKEALVPFFKA